GPDALDDLGEGTAGCSLHREDEQVFMPADGAVDGWVAPDAIHLGQRQPLCRRGGTEEKRIEHDLTAGQRAPECLVQVGGTRAEHGDTRVIWPGECLKEEIPPGISEKRVVHQQYDRLAAGGQPGQAFQVRLEVVGDQSAVINAKVRDDHVTTLDDGGGDMTDQGALPASGGARHEQGRQPPVAAPLQRFEQLPVYRRQQRAELLPLEEPGVGVLAVHHIGPLRRPRDIWFPRLLSLFVDKLLIDYQERRREVRVIIMLIDIEGPYVAASDIRIISGDG